MSDLKRSRLLRKPRTRIWAPGTTAAESCTKQKRRQISISTRSALNNARATRPLLRRAARSRSDLNSATFRYHDLSLSFRLTTGARAADLARGSRKIRRSGWRALADVQHYGGCARGAGSRGATGTSIGSGTSATACTGTSSRTYEASRSNTGTISKVGSRTITGCSSSTSTSDVCSSSTYSSREQGADDQA